MHVYKDIELLGGMEPDCNIYLVDGELIVDAGTGNYFGDVKSQIEGLCDTTRIKTLVNTHCHFDHTGADKKFRDWLKLSIAIHSADRRSLETGQGTMAELFGQRARIMTVDKILRIGAVIKTTNFSFDVIPTPGHTPGSICLYDAKKKILISGDTVFDGSMGRTDLPGGSKEQLLISLKRLSDLNIEHLLPGHGSPKAGGVSFSIKQMTNLLSESENI